MTAPELVGKNIRAYRERIGLSQEAFADAAGLHRTYITQVEQGKRNISISNIFKIAKALEIEPNLLLIADSWKKQGIGVLAKLNNKNPASRRGFRS
ncbi:MAG TPA: helix-turn-helix transcriptional regulator [Candidatus Kapabacteria bacterium]|nr:helix-turn-helix transcriptional regulator [Candidatus Kapabacteria bacterium]